MPKRDELSKAQALALVARVAPKYKPVWDSRPESEQIALALYFLPHGSAKEELEPTRPRLIKWYCPFACQSHFPSGHRYCMNVYTGCEHDCVYCYAAGYEPAQPAAKRDFTKLLEKDLADLEAFAVPPAPAHLSNSTDPFQSRLESSVAHTRRALEGLLAHRRRFTTVTLLTKNPQLAARPEYLALLRALSVLPASHPSRDRFAQAGLPPLQVEVSLAFWRDEARAAYDLCAPSVADRLAGVQALREADIPVVLRIDPLFPRSPLPTDPVSTLADHGLAEAQTLDDLENLVAFARRVGVRHIVYSPVKIVQPMRRTMPGAMRALRDVYKAMVAPEALVFSQCSWRLPRSVSDAAIVRPFLELCRRHGVSARFCMANLCGTP